MRVHYSNEPGAATFPELRQRNSILYNEMQITSRALVYVIIISCTSNTIYYYYYYAGARVAAWKLEWTASGEKKIKKKTIK